MKKYYGTEIATIINKAVDNNDKNGVEKKEETDGKNKYYFYIPNDTNSIKIDIKVINKKNVMTYQMESFYQGEISRFVQNFDTVKFKCTKIEYNSAKRVSYLLFEQIE